MEKEFYSKLEKLLKKDSRLVDKEGDLLKSNVFDAAYKADKKMIEMLLSQKEFKSKFFNKIKNAIVFNINDFVAYIQDKNFLADSYTKYRKKIGLNIDEKFLNERKEVALVWPFKDCVLEGGMTKEDEKRKEIFFNEILAQDEIDKLFAPKVLTNWKRYAQKGREKVKELKRDKEGTIRENLIIKGNNLLALHSLKQQFQNKIKLIYIDPPYNTGNDSFGYNDNFNHSTWLTFMKNRLEAARELLKDDGVIFVQCDDNEQAYLKILMDEVFGRLSFIGEIIWKKRSGVNDSKNLFSSNHDYIICFGINENAKLLGEQKNFTNYTNPDNDPRGKWASGDLTCNKTAEERPNLFYPIKNSKTGVIYKCNPNRVWRTVESKMLKLITEDKIIFPKNGIGTPSYKRHLSEVRSDRQPVSSLFLDYALNQTATKEILNLFNSKKFTTSKPEELLKKIIEISTNENDIVLDFFAGSGTSGAVAHKMDRQYILIEQMDYIHDLPEERLKKVIAGEQGGISKAVNWKGGGDFVYCELMEYNEKFVEKIKKAKDTKALLKIWEEIRKKGFINYMVKPEEFDKNISEFKKLPFVKQQRTLFDLLNKNQLYVNLSEIKDKEFGIGEGDKKLNEEFYER